MMRSVVAVIVCASFLQALWLSLSSGQDIVCSTLGGQSKCCSSNSSCVFVDCEVNGESVAGCYNTTAEASCDDDAQAVDNCNVTSTTAAAGETTPEGTVDCTQHSDDKKKCCGTMTADNTSACIFFSCTDADDQPSGTVCAAADETPACTEEGDTAGDNTCTQEENAGEESTESPTQAPVDCGSLSEDQAGCCVAGNSSACIFFNCTDTEGTVTGQTCVASDATPTCTGDDTPSANICESGAMTTPSGSDYTTQSPSTGGQEGGQEFDAASFIGGIVLCAGLLAIGFFGFKFYKSRQDRNYQSM